MTLPYGRRAARSTSAPAPCSARPLFRREACGMRGGGAHPSAARDRNSSTTFKGWELRNHAALLANAPTIPRGSIKGIRLRPPTHLASSGPAVRANRCLSSNLQVPRSKMPPSQPYYDGGQNDGYYTQY